MCVVLDLKESLGADKERAVDEPSPTDDTLEDCSTSEEESIDSSMASVAIESAESEPVPYASTSSADFENQRHSNTSIHWRDFFRTRKKRQGVSSQGLPIKPKLTRRKKKRIKGDVVPQISSSLDAELSCFKSSWRNFSLSELREATDNFSRGEGGYAEVYKGRLKDGKFVAIKRLTRGSPEEMTVDFLSELGIIVHVDHPNIAQLIGYGVDGGMHLVLQLSPHGSLASLLYGSKEKLNWCIRFKIALGAAEGLCYLHEGCQRR
ncbi:hypothetical protein Goklo_025706, partial [Gossypium klotzschianum]|nr:hypothetical protein [Gossypium klotzschianum]